MFKELLQDKTKLAMIGAGVLAVIVIAVIAMSGGNSDQNALPQANTNEQAKANVIPPTATRQEVPANIVIPEAGATTTDATIAIPVAVTEAAKGSASKLRTFNVSAENQKFNPSEIIANVGDTVHVNFTAVDGTYDMTFPDNGMKQVATKGQTKVFEFQALNFGKYAYYCESCGGLNSTAKGWFVIVPNK